MTTVPYEYCATDLQYRIVLIVTLGKSETVLYSYQAGVQDVRVPYCTVRTGTSTYLGIGGYLLSTVRVLVLGGGGGGGGVTPPR